MDAENSRSLLSQKLHLTDTQVYTCPVIWTSLRFQWASLIAQLVKNPPPIQETLVRSLGGEDPLEKEMVTNSSILAWRIPCTAEPGRLQSMELQSQTWLSIFCYNRKLDFLGGISTFLASVASKLFKIFVPQFPYSKIGTVLGMNKWE